MAQASYNDIAKAIYLSSAEGGGKDFSANVVRFLARKRLMGKSKEILSRLEKIVNESEGVAEVKLRSAHRVPDRTKVELAEFLKKRYGAKKILFTEITDDSLLGGFKIEINNEVIDLTYRNKVNKLKAYLTKN